MEFNLLLPPDVKCPDFYWYDQADEPTEEEIEAEELKQEQRIDEYLERDL